MATSVVKLTIDSVEYDAQLKKAGQALNDYFDICKKGDRTFTQLDEGVLDAVQAMGKMETANKSAKGSLSELKRAFTDMNLTYRRFTDEEKASPIGKAMAQSLSELKVRINDTKKDLADIGQELSGSKFGQFGSIIDGIGHKMGVSANLTELLTSKTALMTAGIGAAVAAIYKGTEAWTKYNAELSKQDQITQVTTGLKGSSADHMTDVMRALSDTYKVDFREAINAANTLMTQFGKSGDEAIQLIKDGMQGMIQGDGSKLLNMIQQFAPAFRDAGISADKLVAIIHNSEGGLFSDQNMNAILMGIKNIRLMTKATSDSLAKLGIDGQEMSRKMSDGSLSVFEALKQVATKLKDCEAGSQEAGQVMQNVFGRQGAMQGMKLARAIAELNTNLEETKKQTGELGDAFAELQTANEKLNTAIRDAFSYDGWEQMATGIKAKLVSALADVLNILDGIRASWGDIMDKMGLGGGKNNYKPIGGGLYNSLPRTTREPSEKADELKKSQDKKSTYNRQVSAYNAQIDEKRQQVKAMTPGEGMPDLMKDTREKINAEIQEIEKIRDKYKELAKDILNPPKPKPGQNEPNTITKSVSKTAQELNPMQQAQKEISALTEEALTADEGRLEVIKKEIAALKKQVKVYQSIQDYAQGKEPNWNIQVGDRKAFEAEQMRRFDVELGISKNAFTEKNVSSFISDLKNQIQTADLGSELYYNLTAQLADANALANLMQTAIKNGIDVTQFNPQDLWKKVFGKNPGDYISDETWQSIQDAINAKLKEMKLDPIKLNFKTGEAGNSMSGISSTDLDKVTSDLGKMTSGISSIASGIEQIGIELPSGVRDVIGVVQGISSILTGISSLVAAISATSAISAIPGFAHGGIAHAANGLFVPGNSYSGDNVPALLNSGELILNKAAQGNLASQLQEGNGGKVSSTPYVLGEQIYLGLTNYLIRSGRGELLTARG